MSTSHHTEKAIARSMFRRLAIGSALAVTPMLIALGAATASHADTGITQTGNDSISAPTQQGTMRNQDIVRGYLPYTSLSHHQKRDYAY